MILIALGANMPHPEHGDPVNTLAAAVRDIANTVSLMGQSSWYRTAPVPVSDQPWFANAVISVETDMQPDDLLARLHGIEEDFGRVRRQKWEARVLDLDLLVFHDLVTENRDQGAEIVLPHPQMQKRAFVLAPIAEIAPEWRHPVSNLAAQELLSRLPSEQAFDIIGAKDIPT
ncbi:2-amino-4-hydroxy-6-hydroxymethyldihydropteridine diphosphokinase [Sneathiella sp.]|uniref:2-amino-4-hydroxy-6- hydroxymethyldihydropteridine diphosphokinase n=1 Tax=Sneathiella sp. TaxID=1964365 RepID=UPI0025EE8CE6|nr:2-amino-4-hydroxy-6-hydroxymethyldihydropteridine diphosphokinase [Sneathiella sp.]